MERNYNNRDFEQFVKQNADQYRMFPSDKVWNGINNALHTRRRWYGVGLALLLLLTGAGVSWIMIGSNIEKSQPVASAEIILPAKNKAIADPQPPKIFSKNNTSPVAAIQFSSITPASVATVGETNIDLTHASDSPVASTNYSINNTVAELKIASQIKNDTRDLLITNIAPAMAKSAVVELKNSRTAIVADDNTAIETSDNTASQYQDLIKKESQLTHAPYTIESVVNSYKKRKQAKHIEWQLYLTPAVSYRKLSENKTFLAEAARNGAVPSFTAYSDVKNYVTHKPDIGLELGFTGKYNLTKAIKVKGGIQFNISRYDIKAFASNPGETATIALDAGPGNASSITRQTAYRTLSGNSVDWIKNLYYSISAPLGAELRLTRNKSTYFSIGATIQPTYILSDKAYLVSTDYKNYVTVPESILRKWNMNAGFEAMVTFNTAKMNLQMGPQIRYQIRSSFLTTYPIKENLFDFGFKVGVSLNHNRH